MSKVDAVQFGDDADLSSPVTPPVAMADQGVSETGEGAQGDGPHVEAPDNVTPFPRPAPSPEAARTSILAFTRDATVIDTLRKAAPRDAAIIQAAELGEVTAHLPADVLVLDAACAPDVPAMATQLNRQFPELVIIVAGRREESAGFMKLTAAGQIYRFLLVPLAIGQTRLTLEASLRRHVERAMEGAEKHLATGAMAATVPPRGSLGVAPKWLAAAAIGVLVLIGGIWSLLREPSPTGPSVAPAAATAGPPASAQAGPADRSLAAARAALQAQQYVEPAGSSALDYFRAALAQDPANREAQQGLQTVADRLVERAETELLAERLEAAVGTVEQVRAMQPAHSRLPFMDAQIRRERERLQLTQAQEVTSRLRTLLGSAGQRLEAGRLVGPDGARELLLEARRLDATNPAVIQGIRDLVNRLVAEAERAAVAGQREQAAPLLAAARALNPADPRYASIDRLLTDAAPPVAATAVSPAASTTATSSTATAPAAAPRNVTAAELGLARERLTEGRLLDPIGDSARDHLFAARTSAPDDAQVRSLLQELKTRLIGAGTEALRAQEVDAAGRLLDSAADLGIRGDDPALDAARRELNAARAERDFRTNVVSAGSLNRTRTVAADYPVAAQRRRQEGWVDLEFTVTAEGTVTDVSVSGTSAPGVFEQTATRALSGWRFEPVMRGGRAVAQRAAVRVSFELGD